MAFELSIYSGWMIKWQSVDIRAWETFISLNASAIERVVGNDRVARMNFSSKASLRPDFQQLFHRTSILQP